MSRAGGLPPGQVEIAEFPRFGWGKFASRFPPKTEAVEIAVRGDVDLPLIVRDELRDLPRVDQTSDLHCVTTWSKCGPVERVQVSAFWHSTWVAQRPSAALLAAAERRSVGRRGQR